MVDKTREFYAKRYGKPSSIKKDPRLKKVMDIFKTFKFGTMLDIGCGDGSFSNSLKEASNASEIYGVEISDEGIAKATVVGVKVLKTNLNFDALPFNENYFDGIFCGEVIEHLFDPDALIDEIYRVLRPEGICVITTPNLAWWCNRVALFLGYQPYYTDVSSKYNIGKFLRSSNDVAGHIRVFTNRAFLQLIKMHSFKLEAVYGVPSYYVPFPVSLLDLLLSRFPGLSSISIVVLKK